MEKNLSFSLWVTPLEGPFMFFMRPSEISFFCLWLLAEELVRWVLHPCECWKWKTGKGIIFWLLLSRLGNDIFGLSEESHSLSTHYPPPPRSCCLNGLYPSSKRLPFLQGKLILCKLQCSLVYSLFSGFALNQTWKTKLGTDSVFIYFCNYILSFGALYLVTTCW